MAYGQDTYGTDPMDPQATPAQNWWEGPPPANYNPQRDGPWPPPLPPGATYGREVGSINYAPGTGPILNGNPVLPKPGTGPAPTAATGGKGPADGNWQAWFLNLTNGKPPTPAQLAAMEGDLTAAGVKVIRNAQGVPGKIQLPGGQIVDVIQGAGRGGVAWQWLTGEGGGGGGVPNGSLGSLTDPFTGTFTAPPIPTGPAADLPPVPEFTPPGYTPPPAFAYDAFKAPSYEQAGNDPGYQFALKQGAQALEQGAAAKGVLNTGGTLKDLLNYGQAAGATQYNNVFSRDLSAYGQNYKTAADTYATNTQTQHLQPYEFAYRGAMDSFVPKMTQYAAQVAAGQQNKTNDYNRSWEQYLQSWNQFRDQRDSTWNKNFSYATV